MPTTKNTSYRVHVQDTTQSEVDSAIDRDWETNHNQL